jgi:hypothetical protein
MKHKPNRMPWRKIKKAILEEDIHNLSINIRYTLDFLLWSKLVFFNPDIPAPESGKRFLSKIP